MVKDVLGNWEITAHDIFQELVSEGLYKYALDLTLHSKAHFPSCTPATSYHILRMNLNGSFYGENQL